MIEIAAVLVLLAWLRRGERLEGWRSEWGLARFYQRQDEEAKNPQLRFVR